MQHCVTCALARSAYGHTVICLYQDLSNQYPFNPHSENTTLNTQVCIPSGRPPLRVARGVLYNNNNDNNNNNNNTNHNSDIDNTY